jgi:predicted GH43/DUF377 family glycosyl hydrolase
MSLRFMTLPVLGLLLVSCGPSAQSEDVSPEPPNEEPAAGTTIDLSKLTPECFVPHPRNPIIPWSSHFEGSTWNDPSVLYVDGQFVMYLSSDVSFNHDIEIHRLISDDGITWTHSPSRAVFSRSASGWDSASVETPSVVHFNGQYHLFYTGYATRYDDVFDFKIGHAVSDDGVHWTRRDTYVTAPSDPRNATPNLDFNQWIVAEPGAVVFNDRLHLYFTAVGAHQSVGTTMQVIGSMSSLDGVTWSTPAQTLLPDQGLYPRAAGYLGYSTPAGVEIDGKLHLFFDVVRDAPAWQQVKLHHAVSQDGRTGWIKDGSSIHAFDDFHWTATEIRSPSPLLVGSKLYLWYAGHHLGGAAGVGLSICDLTP